MQSDTLSDERLAELRALRSGGEEKNGVDHIADAGTMVGVPVAWRVNHGGGSTFWNVESNAQSNALATNGTVEPLYALTNTDLSLRAENERLRKERDAAQADAYKAGIAAIDRLADFDKANERAAKNWRDFRDLRIEILGDGPMCRDCADFDGRCQGNGPPCDPDEAVKEQLATWRKSKAKLDEAVKVLERVAEDQVHTAFGLKPTASAKEASAFLSNLKGAE